MKNNVQIFVSFMKCVRRLMLLFKIDSDIDVQIDLKKKSCEPKANIFQYKLFVMKNDKPYYRTLLGNLQLHSYNPIAKLS